MCERLITRLGETWEVAGLTFFNLFLSNSVSLKHFTENVR